MNAAPGQANAERQDTHKPPGTKAAAGQHQARGTLGRQDKLPGPSLPNHQEQERGMEEHQLKKELEKH